VEYNDQQAALMMDTDISLSRAVERAYRGWWLLPVCMMLGALFGFVFSALRPALFEARVEYTFSIDFGRTGTLTDVEQDQAFEAMSDVIFSSPVFEQVADRAAAQGIDLDWSALQSNSTKERTLNTWVFRVRHPDPQQAALIANLWGEQALAALQAASQSALEVGVLQASLDSLVTCLSTTAMIEPAPAQCTGADLPQIQARIVQTGQAISAARQASRGMLPGMGYQWTQKAAPPARPVVYGRGGLVLAGALIGLLAALALLQFGPAKGRTGYLRHA
jgi:hypothetical protein